MTDRERIAAARRAVVEDLAAGHLTQLEAEVRLVDLRIAEQDAKRDALDAYTRKASPSAQGKEIQCIK